MKKLWRYIKWSFAGFGWFEAYMSSICFFMAAAGVAGLLGDVRLRNLFFVLTLGIVAVAIAMVICRGFVYSWRQFVKHDEQVFDILKQKDIK